jgi:hypothetical protein
MLIQKSRGNSGVTVSTMAHNHGQTLRKSDCGEVGNDGPNLGRGQTRVVCTGFGERGRGVDGFYGMGDGRGDAMKREIPIQNIPIRTELGKQARDAFRTIPDVILDADYDGLEQRIAERTGLNPDDPTECSDDGKCWYHAVGGDLYDPCGGRNGS